MAHIRQSRPDSGLGVQEEVLKTFEFVPYLLGSGYHLAADDAREMGRDLEAEVFSTRWMFDANCLHFLLHNFMHLLRRVRSTLE